MRDSEHREQVQSVHYPLTGVRPVGANPAAFWMIVAGSSVAGAILFVAGVLLAVPV